MNKSNTYRMKIDSLDIILFKHKLDLITSCSPNHNWLHLSGKWVALCEGHNNVSQEDKTQRMLNQMEIKKGRLIILVWKIPYFTRKELQGKRVQELSIALLSFIDV